MPRMIVSIDGVVIRELQVTKDRTSLGRRPYNDLVIDNLAVSGEHAVLQMSGNQFYLEDLSSTNGTFVNGRAVKKHLMQDNDVVEIGRYKIKYANDGMPEDQDRTLVATPGSAERRAMAAAANAPARSGAAAIKVLSGAAAGREVALVKVVTTIGKPGVAVAAITRRSQGYVIAHVEGEIRPVLNGTAVGADPLLLASGDRLELAGTRMQFVQE
ncbi:MAG: FHA domain-containing protein [Polaromonas sp.]|nr:FHA domain-containing protein [Polaromonas sp.]